MVLLYILHIDHLFFILLALQGLLFLKIIHNLIQFDIYKVFDVDNTIYTHETVNYTIRTLEYLFENKYENNHKREVLKR